MEPNQNKKTGLGSSLLLQRTEPTSASQPRNARDVQTPEVPETSALDDVEQVPAAGQTPRTLKRPQRSPHSQRRGKARVIPRQRCTLHLDEDVEEQLDLVARVEGKERSEVVSDLLRTHLPKYRIQIQKE